MAPEWRHVLVISFKTEVRWNSHSMYGFDGRADWVPLKDAPGGQKKKNVQL